MIDQTPDVGVREAILTALKGVVKHAGQSVGPVVRTRIYTLLKDLIYSEDEQLRTSSSSIFGIISQVSIRSPLRNICTLGASVTSGLNIYCCANCRYWLICKQAPALGFISTRLLFNFCIVLHTFCLNNLPIAVLGRCSNLWGTPGIPSFSIISKLGYKAWISPHHLCHP